MLLLRVLRFQRAGRLLDDLFVTRLNLALGIGTDFADNCPAVTGRLAGPQPKLVGGRRLAQSRGWRIEDDSRPADTVIQSLIREHQPIVNKLCRYPLAAAFPPNTSHLEDISQISIEFDGERKFNGRAPVIMDSKSLVACFLPKNL